MCDGGCDSPGGNDGGVDHGTSHGSSRNSRGGSSGGSSCLGLYVYLGAAAFAGGAYLAIDGGLKIGLQESTGLSAKTNCRINELPQRFPLLDFKTGVTTQVVINYSIQHKKH